MKRREFLEKTGKAVALAAVTGGAAFLFHNRAPGQYHAIQTTTADFTVPRDPQLPTISLARETDHVAAMRKSLDAVGGIRRFVKPGERVTIKPNVGWDRTAEQAANTNPILVAEMVQLCLAAGASKVVVTDVSCNDSRRCFLRSGIKEAAEKAGAEVYLESEEDFREVDIRGQVLTTWPVLKYFLNTDRFINMPIVKQHSLTRCTIGLKNLYGILGGPRHKLHQKIDQSIVDLARFSRPTLTVVDATRVLLHGGPQGGSLDDVAHEHTVICSTDQVAADARGAEFLGLSGEMVSHIRLAEKSGLGSVDYRAVGYKEIA
jgi:uncharacterized protein (DUF362 family)